MTRLVDLINPPPIEGVRSPTFDRFLSTNFEYSQALSYLMNPSVLLNPNFSELSAKGTNATTESDGDATEFVKDWFVVGATVADYIITPTAYAANSTIQSSSPYYINIDVTSYSAGDFYIYQRQVASVRRYQERYLTYGLHIKNNGANTVNLRLDVFSDYDGSTQNIEGEVLNIEPGEQLITSTNLTQSLSGKTVGANPYTEFRLVFLNLPGGIADLDLYLIKNEYGIAHTAYSD